MKEKKRLRILYIYILILIAVGVVTLLTAFRLQWLKNGINHQQEVTEEYIESRQAISAMKEASNYLTDESRSFVIGGDPRHLQRYLDEVQRTKRREQALDVLAGYKEAAASYKALVSAAESSRALEEVEMYAMRLKAESAGMLEQSLKTSFPNTVLSAEDAALSAEEKEEKAVQMLFDENYQMQQDGITQNISTSMQDLIEDIRDVQMDSYEETLRLLRWLFVSILLVLGVLFLILIVTANYVILPLNRGVAFIREHKMLPVRGAAEYAYLAEAYNGMLQKTHKDQEILSYEASHDELTNLYNRKAFEKKREELAGTDHAMLLVDVDYFKSVNDTHGHEIGDKVLKNVASILASCFRTEDYICRIGGDEFVILMQHMNESLKHVAEAKILRVRELLKKTEGLPSTTVSIGIAFSSKEGEEDMFRKADEALYAVKETGRNGYAFYGEPPKR